MKTNVLNSLLLAVSMAACLFWSGCANDRDLPGVHPADESAMLEVTTGIHAAGSVLKSGPVTDFTEGSRLGLFITTGNLDDDYSSAASRNVLSTLVAGRWNQTPAVNLYAQDAVIYAYYPYNAGYANGREIPVQSGLTDFMYGTHTPGQQAVNKDNRTVNLTMNHALALVQFNIYKANYPWQGRLDRVCINNAPDKEVVHYSGKLDVQTGNISGLWGTDWNIQVNSIPLMMIPEDKPTDEKEYVKLLLIPTPVTSSRGDVIVTFDIDGREFKWEVPAGTQWKQGTKNTYDVLLNGNELRIGEVKIADWTDGTGGNAFLE